MEFYLHDYAVDLYQNKEIKLKSIFLDSGCTHKDCKRLRSWECRIQKCKHDNRPCIYTSCKKQQMCFHFMVKTGEQCLNKCLACITCSSRGRSYGGTFKVCARPVASPKPRLQKPFPPLLLIVPAAGSCHHTGSDPESGSESLGFSKVSLLVPPAWREEDLI